MWKSLDSLHKCPAYILCPSLRSSIHGARFPTEEFEYTLLFPVAFPARESLNSPLLFQYTFQDRSISHPPQLSWLQDINKKRRPGEDERKGKKQGKNSLNHALRFVRVCVFLYQRRLLPSENPLGKKFYQEIGVSQDGGLTCLFRNSDADVSLYKFSRRCLLGADPQRRRNLFCMFTHTRRSDVLARFGYFIRCCSDLLFSTRRQNACAYEVLNLQNEQFHSLSLSFSTIFPLNLERRRRKDSLYVPALLDRTFFGF